MPLACLGLSHQTAPVDVRERHAFGPGARSESLIALRDYDAVREAVILSTCNRLEIYAELEDIASGVSQLKQFLATFRHGAIPYDIAPYLYTLVGPYAVEHLLRVATGLDSMLIGEAEILGQVKEAYTQAQGAHSLGRSLHRLFQEALASGKAARSQTGIGNSSVSAATAAIAVAKEHVGTLHGTSILLVGAGKMGETAAKRLKLEGAQTLVVMNRTHRRARELVDRLNIGSASELPALVEALSAADIVITSTGASHFILNVGDIAEAMLRRPDRPLLIVDLAVPRDADPNVARIPGVRLVDIDALGAAVDLTLEERSRSIPMVEEIIAEYQHRYAQWYDARSAVPLIASLAKKAETLRNSEIERLFGRCPELTQRDRMLITGMTLTIVSKILHGPMTRIREKTDGTGDLDDLRLLAELFELQLAEYEDAPPG